MSEFEYNTDFKDIICKHCGYQGKPERNGATNEVHGYALKCPSCKKFWGWGGRSKALKDEAGVRQLSSNWTAKRLGVDKCQCCLRDKDHLGETECLEVHHVIPVQLGGEDAPRNLWVVCTPCHKQIHWLRTYIHNHMKRYFSTYDQAKEDATQ